MSGVLSNLKEDIQKSHDLKKREKMKFLLALVATNLLVAMMCLPQRVKEVQDQGPMKILHPGYQLMALPLTVLLPYEHKKMTEVPVSLVTKNKKVFVAKAFLHEEIQGHPQSEGQSIHFKIEIPNTHVHLAGEFSGEDMIAIPYVELKKRPLMTRGSRYEVSL